MTFERLASVSCASIRGGSGGRWVALPTRRLLAIADIGGSSRNRTRLWQLELQGLADDMGLRIAVSHFPPGTSKRHKIEHRMFSRAIQEWRGSPPVSRDVVVNLIGAMLTGGDAEIPGDLDECSSEAGLNVTDEQLASLDIDQAKFRGEWNYTPPIEFQSASRGGVDWVALAHFNYSVSSPTPVRRPGRNPPSAGPLPATFRGPARSFA